MQPALPTTPEAVRQWRRDTCRISQADTATVLGISRSSIARYEAGKWPVPMWLSDEIHSLTERLPKGVR